jgi:hypothetical protein
MYFSELGKKQKKEAEGVGQAQMAPGYAARTTRPATQ